MKILTTLLTFLKLLTLLSSIFSKKLKDISNIFLNCGSDCKPAVYHPDRCTFLLNVCNYSSKIKCTFDMKCKWRNSSCATKINACYKNCKQNANGDKCVSKLLN